MISAFQRIHRLDGRHSICLDFRMCMRYGATFQKSVLHDKSAFRLQRRRLETSEYTAIYQHSSA